ncbi:MAG: DUF1559 domain-containing protein [Patescibacteria group bacterium]|nr:DUF1559 domain-containing protein [Patescibacteria group bacterium]
MNTSRSASPLQRGTSDDFGKNWRPDHRRHLKRLCYGMAMLAASLVAFGAAGLWPALAIVATWAWVFFRAPHTKGMTEAAFAWVVLFILYQALTPTVYDSREPTSSVACTNNLKQVALGLLNYHGRYRVFPPAHLADGDGRPMHSWRVLILPFLEREDIYSQYRFDEPWDGPIHCALTAAVGLGGMTALSPSLKQDGVLSGRRTDRESTSG